MASGWLSDDITFWIISMFWQSIFKFSGRHSNIFTVWGFWTVWFGALPIINTICCITCITSLFDFMLVSWCSASQCWCLFHCIGADFAGFPAFLPARGFLMCTSLYFDSPVLWVQFWLTEQFSKIVRLPVSWHGWGRKISARLEASKNIASCCFWKIRLAFGRCGL